MVILFATLFAALAACASAYTAWLEWQGKRAYVLVESFRVDTAPERAARFCWSVKNCGGRPARDISLRVEPWDVGFAHGSPLDPRDGTVEYLPQDSRSLLPYRQDPGQNALKPDPWRLTSYNDVPPGASLTLTKEWNVQLITAQWIRVIVSYRDAWMRRGLESVSFYEWGGIEHNHERFPPLPMSAENAARFSMRLQDAQATSRHGRQGG